METSLLNEPLEAPEPVVDAEALERRRALSAGDAARDAGDWLTAARHYGDYLKLAPEDWGIRVQYGHVLKEAGHLEEAEAAYQTASNGDPTSYDSYLHLAHLQKRMGKVHAAQATFLKAFDLDQGFGEPFRELLILGYPVSRLQAKAAARGLAIARDVETEAYCFDVSDLIQYFQNARVATGIQRVQIRIIGSLVDTEEPERRVSVVCYSAVSKGWVQIPNALFVELVRVAAEGSDTTDPVWTAVRDSVSAMVSLGAPVRFRRGATLVNLGTSWWLRNYFLSVRNAKAEFDIRYVPFVHDCIPALMPEHCVHDLTRDFLEWIRGVFAHADFYLCNSEWTRRDLVKVSEAITGNADLPSAVIRLDGDARLDAPVQEEKVRTILRRYGLQGDDFVLFVSTIESRKNHLVLFDVWLRLLRDLGPDRVPRLICVGNRGWKVDNALRTLETSELLKSHVTIAHGISDEDLRVLYQTCRFSVYPSLYEGWGLPVTEALCYGKAVVSSNSSSLPEAGGDHAVYFDPLNAREFLDIVTGLLTDPEKLADARAKAAGFVPRRWSDIAIELQDAIARGTEGAPLPAHGAVPALGTYYTLQKDTAAQLHEAVASGERFRVGSGWSTLDDFGCWMEEYAADLVFGRPDGVEGPLDLHIMLYGLPGGSKMTALYRFKVGARAAGTASVLAGRRFVTRIAIEPEDWRADGTVAVTIQTDKSDALSRYSEGQDPRVVHGGVVALLVAPKGDLQARVEFLEGFFNAGA